MNQKTSKGRFAEFLKKFRRGELKQEEKSAKAKASPKPDRAQKKLQRLYLKLYIQQLWPHSRMVIVLTLLAITVAALELIQPLFARHIIDKILLVSDSSDVKFARLHVVGSIFLAVVLISQILGVLRSWNQQLLNMRVILTLRRALFDRLVRLPLDQLSEMKVGGIISRLTDDINKTTGLMQMAVISPGVAVLRLLMAIVILFTLNWKLALTALGIIPPIMLLSLIAIRKIRPIYRAIRKDVSLVDGRVGEAFQGIRAVRAFGGEPRESHEYTLAIT